jgi:hypothetical protein
MGAAVGDKIAVRGHHVGDGGREGVILAVEGHNGEPPYLVRWQDDGHESVFSPGPDADVEHLPAAPGG